MKLPLLFLCHRIPYPPNKGDKIRSFHLLHHLSKHFDIYMATFVDDPADWPYVPEVEKFCQDCFFVEQKKWLSRLKSLKALLAGDALSIPYYSNREMELWVRSIVRKHGIQHVMVYSSSMAQYVLDHPDSFHRKVVDFVDVDSDKWQQYSEQKKWPLSWLYRREARCLLSYEALLAEIFDAGLFVSSIEADLFRSLSPSTADKIGHYDNGVNAGYFRPSSEYLDPYPREIHAVVFTGAMDYWPNVDAVSWFVHNVFSALHKLNPGIHFYIVGSNPSRAVTRLSSVPGVVVTGRVEDVRPYLQFATAVVAPMRVARGVQNKVLEAMAMEKTVLVSSKGLEGIDALHEEQVLLADTVSDYHALLQEVIAGSHTELGQNARRYVTSRFNWDNNLPEVVLLLDQEPHDLDTKEISTCGPDEV